MSSGEENVTEISISQAAIAAGLGLLIMTVFAIFAFNFVFSPVIVAGDLAATVQNIKDHELLFRVGICSLLIVIICDVVVAWGLFVFLKPVNKSLSLLMAWFRLVYSTIFAIALIGYFGALRFVNSAEFSNAFEQEQLSAQVLMSINVFNDGWAIGFIFFGLHIALIGFLILKSDYIPKVLGIILILVGIAYLADYFSKFLFPAYELNAATYLGWGELLLMFWLLIKGYKINEIRS